MQQDIEAALAFHQLGNLGRAAGMYEAILAKRSEDVAALHLLGVVALQQGDLQRALCLLARAIALKPTVATFHCHIAEVHRRLGQYQLAVRECQTALALEPKYPEAANILGLVWQAQNQTAAAIAQFEEALRLDSQVADFHNNLANALRIQGDRVRAGEHFRQAIALDPNLAEAHNNLGQFLLEQHALQEALEHCRQAVRLKPDFAEAHNNLGNALREMGALEEAKACYAEALRLNPSVALVCNNMGQALQQEGKLDEAAAWYVKGLEQDSGSARIRINLASALQEQGKFSEAISNYETVLRAAPDSAEAHNGLGFARHEQGRYPEAMSHYRQAIELKPDFAAAHHNLGILREEMNDFPDAETCFREVLRHDPTHAGARAQLATMLGSRLPEADLVALRQLLAHPLLPATKKSALHFGLGHVLDVRGAYCEAAEHVEEANRLCREEWRKQGKSYNPAEHSQFVDDLIASFTKAFFRQAKDFGLETQRPVFIVGLPRSGTTLIEQILASHSQVFGAGELRLARQAFEAMPQVASLDAAPMACLPALDRGDVRRLARMHLNQLQEVSPEAARVVDKMPDNYLYLGLLAVQFPRARFIHCRRDLRDVAVSCWMTNFRHIRWARDTEHLAARFRDYRRTMDHWQSVLPVPLLEIHYEETVADLEAVARRLVSWCGLHWEPACLAFHKTRRPVRTASVAQVRQPLYSRAVARWKNYDHALSQLFSKL
jgi:tetratricopeptide (TPR) repeat protein